MKKLLLTTFGLFLFFAIFSININSFAGTDPKAPLPKTTLDTFNPFGSGGIKCLYAYTGKSKTGTVVDGNIGSSTNKDDPDKQKCTTEQGLLNRVESLLYILAPSFAVIGIMLGGYKMMQDGYDSKGEGMKTIRGAILGLVIVLTAFFVRNLIYTVFNDTFTDPEGVTIANNSAKVIIEVIKAICYQFLIPIGSPIAVGFVIWGGYQLITAGGDAKKIDAGTKTVRNAIIGFLVIIFAAALVSISQNLLSGFFGTVQTIKP
jgi:Type IV secretion system pilin